MLDETPKVRFAPKIQAEEWDQCTIYRETFLASVTDPEENEAFRAYGKVQENHSLEAKRWWSYSCMDATAHDLQAVLADLRHLQGYLQFIIGAENHYEEGETPKVKKRHRALRKLARDLSSQVGTVADGLEKEVGGWDFEAE